MLEFLIIVLVLAIVDLVIDCFLHAPFKSKYSEIWKELQIKRHYKLRFILLTSIMLYFSLNSKGVFLC